eukprot:6481252-Amphidinium_carterae.1
MWQKVVASRVRSERKRLAANIGMLERSHVHICYMLATWKSGTSTHTHQHHELELLNTWSCYGGKKVVSQQHAIVKRIEISSVTVKVAFCAIRKLSEVRTEWTNSMRTTTKA